MACFKTHQVTPFVPGESGAVGEVGLGYKLQTAHARTAHPSELH